MAIHTKLMFGVTTPIYQTTKLTLLGGINMRCVLGEPCYQSGYLTGRRIGIERSHDTCLTIFRMYWRENQGSFRRTVAKLDENRTHPEYQNKLLRATILNEGTERTCGRLLKLVQEELRDNLLQQASDGPVEVGHSSLTIQANPEVSVALEQEVSVFSKPLILSIGASRNLQTHQNEIFFKGTLSFDNFLSTPFGEIRGALIQTRSKKTQFSLDVVKELKFSKASSIVSNEISKVGTGETVISGEGRSESSRVSLESPEHPVHEVLIAVQPPVVPPEQVSNGPLFGSLLAGFGFFGFWLFLRLTNQFRQKA
jgi:hypothetical protein